MSPNPELAPFSALAANERPDVLDVECGTDTAVVTLLIPATLIWFEGHFPERPVLPGVAQVHLAGVAAAALLNPTGHALGTGRLKFRRPVLPGAHLKLQLKRTASGIRFEFTDSDQIYTSGSLLYSAATP